MKTIKYSIAPAIFAKFPAYLRCLVVVTDIRNTVAAPDVLQSLREAERVLNGAMPLEQLLASQKIANWRDAFRQMGVNPSEHRPAHEALARRALQGKPLPDINPAVNIGNVLSLRHSAPIGVHPVDAIKTGMDLRLSSGDESFMAFGSEKIERPRVGEIVFADGNEILCRCWVWRQSRSSITTPEARSIVINIDALPPLDEDSVARIGAEACTMIMAACGGQTAQYILSASNPVVNFEV